MLKIVLYLNIFKAKSVRTSFFCYFCSMRLCLSILALCMLSAHALPGQGKGEVYEIPADTQTTVQRNEAEPVAFGRASAEIENGEMIYTFQMPVVRCYSRPKDMSRYYKTVYNVKKVYPIAKEAERLLAQIEENIDSMATNRDQRAYIRQMEKELLAEYTPVLKNMTFSQGKILIKLLDRQTARTGYSIVKELRGGFRAGIYQGIGRIFGMNLKDRYDKDGDDQLIEEIIEMVELGLL